MEHDLDNCLLMLNSSKLALSGYGLLATARCFGDLGDLGDRPDTLVTPPTDGFNDAPTSGLEGVLLGDGRTGRRVLDDDPGPEYTGGNDGVIALVVVMLALLRWGLIPLVEVKDASEPR